MYYCPDMRYLTTRHVPIPRFYIILPKVTYFNKNSNMRYTVTTVCITSSGLHILRRDRGQHSTHTNPYHSNLDWPTWKPWTFNLFTYAVRFDFGGRKCMVAIIHLKLFQQRMLFFFFTKFMLWGFKLETEMKWCFSTYISHTNCITACPVFQVSKRLCFYVSFYRQKLSLYVNEMSLLCPSFLHMSLLACLGIHYIH
jgi:hypothetical protein